MRLRQALGQRETAAGNAQEHKVVCALIGFDDLESHASEYTIDIVAGKHRARYIWH